MRSAQPLPPISTQIWDAKYRLRAADGSELDRSIEDTWRRVARAVAAAEPKRLRARWEDRFAQAMADFAFLPAGRILAGAGAGRAVTLFNCFVMGKIHDDLGSIFTNVAEAARTMQQGGGIGHDFSALRPKGARVQSIGADASGPVSFMDVWDAMCRTIMSAGARRGAMMATLRCDHPDIETFIDVKADAARLRNFNLSVLVTDAFVRAVERGDAWDLTHEGRVYRTLDARALWDRIMRATYEYAEPGVVFIDRINARNNLAYCEEIGATNPCGEQPLPPYGACLLGSINLARLIENPFSPLARIDEERLVSLTATAVRFLDNVIDVSGYPLPAQKKEAKAKRRIGLGITGLADALILLGVRYGTPEALRLAESWMSTIQSAAYRASAELARGKGSFPLFEAEAFLAAPNVQSQPAEIRACIARHGMRNGLVTSIAPTGTISLLAGNVSSGIEPVFDFRYERRVLERDGSSRTEPVEDYAHALYRAEFGPKAPLSDAFVTAEQLAPRAHLDMQAVLQRHVDSSISKTINCPADISFSAFRDVYLEAYALGLKGCTTYRPNAVTGAVLQRNTAPARIPPPRESPIAGAIVAARAEASPVGQLSGQPAGLLTGQLTGQVAGQPTGSDLAGAPGEIVYMAEPLQRDGVLAGFTYKLRWPGSDHAMYITINDIERDGRRRPFEIFINSKNLEHYAWTVALTRMISAIFRRGGDVAFVVEELKAVFDPQGGQWMDGRYVPSLLAAIGQVIEDHMTRSGFLVQSSAVSELGGAREMVAVGEARGGEQARGKLCPRCSAFTLRRREGCLVCDSCGYSKCS